MKRSIILSLGIMLAFAITACSDSGTNSVIIAPPSSKTPASISQAPPKSEQVEQGEGTEQGALDSDAEQSKGNLRENELNQAEPRENEPSKEENNTTGSLENNGTENPTYSTPISGAASSNPVASSTKEAAMTTMIVTVNGKDFTATLEKNVAVDAFVKMLQEGDISINMSDYSGFEKIGSLGTSLPTSNSQMTTTSGDIVLYGSNQIVVFYGSNSWSYTKLGKINDLTGWSEALGYGDATIQFSAN